MECRSFHLRYSDSVDAAQGFYDDLAVTLGKLGIRVMLDTKGEGDDRTGWLVFAYDPYEVKLKQSRGAGAKCKDAKESLTLDVVRARMRNGDTAENIAAELGICRRTLFRRIKRAEENGFKYV